MASDDGHGADAEAPAVVAAAEAAAPMTLLSLPDDLLLRCLTQLCIHDRFRYAPLACKRFHELTLHPDMLEGLTFLMRGQQLLPRCRALLRFFLQHAQHMASITLQFKLPADLGAEQLGELGSIVVGCLSACGASGYLDTLTLGDDKLPIGRLVPSLAWLPAFTDLCQLRLFLGDDTSLQLPGGLSRLTALWAISVRASCIELDPDDPQLPSSLEWANLWGRCPEATLQQVLSLSNLTTLELNDDTPGGDRLQGLTALRGVTDLVLMNQAQLPACLSALTWLKVLDVDQTGRDLEHEEVLGLEAALLRLTQLTHLALACCSPRVLPATLQLPCLQRFGYSTEHEPAAPIPEGPWLARLRWLLLPWSIARISTDHLAAAPQLEHLLLCDAPRTAEVLGPGDSPDPEWRAFWRFVVEHPCLHCLTFVTTRDSQDSLSIELLDALAALSCRRPALVWRRTEDPWHDLRKINVSGIIPKLPGE